MTQLHIPDLDDKTHFLLNPASYPEGTTSVRLVETHMARVFLTDRFAYKMKKPVRSSYLDFSSLDKRYAVCLEELRLNRRLTDDVYLDAVPLCLTAPGRLTLQEAGTPVEWLVKMRRLPAEASLPQRLATLDAAGLAPLLQRLQTFYRHAVPIPLTGNQYLARLRRQVDTLRTALLAPELEEKLTLDRDAVDSVARALVEFSAQQQPLLDARGALIVEGHGDLRPEHCFLTEPPQVIDCLEFNRTLRCVDPLDELSYLALECELLGRADLAQQIVHSAGAAPAELVRFYQCYRALLRAQLAAAHLQDGRVNEPDKWRRKTGTYLAAALQRCP
ncbi:hypothetical protein [Microbulbifer sp. SAOS-129_SWC]|uniref:hypothetical protein n=1 Tax=Microbulbifer sp. SAOS-129_SWC TaxID=3145235 RepID=UPI00321734DD